MYSIGLMAQHNMQFLHCIEIPGISRKCQELSPVTLHMNNVIEEHTRHDMVHDYCWIISSISL